MSFLLILGTRTFLPRPNESVTALGMKWRTRLPGLTLQLVRQGPHTLLDPILGPVQSGSNTSGASAYVELRV